MWSTCFNYLNQLEFVCLRNVQLLRTNDPILYNFCEQKLVQHALITTAVDYNAHSLLIFEETWSSYASRTKLNGHLVLTPEPIGLCIASYQGFYAKFVSMTSSKCLIVEVDGELMLMALHIHFLSGLCTVFGFSRFDLWMRMPVSFTFSQDDEHSELTVHPFFQNPYKVISQYFLALFKRIHNRIRSAEG